MRSISLVARAAFNAEQTGEIPVFLLTVTHALLTGPRRFSTDPTTRIQVDPELIYGTVSRGETYNFLPIGVMLPGDNDEEAPAFRLTMDNIMRDLVPLLRTMTTPAKVTIEMVLATAPDLVEIQWPDFDLVNADYNQESVVVDLVVDSLTTDPYPAGRFTPSGFGGLF